jgi:hypothetical protein
VSDVVNLQGAGLPSRERIGTLGDAAVAMVHIIGGLSSIHGARVPSASSRAVDQIPSFDDWSTSSGVWWAGYQFKIDTTSATVAWIVLRIL